MRRSSVGRVRSVVGWCCGVLDVGGPELCSDVDTLSGAEGGGSYTSGVCDESWVVVGVPSKYMDDMEDEAVREGGSDMAALVVAAIKILWRQSNVLVLYISVMTTV